MASTAFQQIRDAAESINTSSEKLDTFINGAAGTSVETANGSVPSIATVAQTFGVNAVEVVKAKELAESYANFAGRWDDLTGTLAVPSSVFHKGEYWMLLDGLADVTASEPSRNNTNWRRFFSVSEVNKATTRALKWYNDDTSALRLNYGHNFYVAGDEVNSFDMLHTFSRNTDKTGYDKRGKLVTFAPNEPAIVFDPITGEYKGISIHESRTNLYTHSRNFADAYWAKTAVTITPNALLAPDGTTTMSKLVEDNTNNVHRIFTSANNNANPHVVSIYAAPAERTKIMIYVASGANTTNVIYDLVNGTVSDSANGSMELVGNGIYRCIFKLNETQSTNAVQFRLINDTNDSAYLGDGTSGLYIWGAQLEAGSFATPPIFTTTTSLTRLADNCTIEDIDQTDWWNPLEGTFVVEFESDFPAAGAPRILNISDGTVANRIDLNINQLTGAVKLTHSADNAFEEITSTIVSSGQRVRVAFAYSADRIAMSVLGNDIAADTSPKFPTTLDVLYLGAHPVYSGKLNGVCPEVTYYDKALSDADLIRLSTLEEQL